MDRRLGIGLVVVLVVALLATIPFALRGPDVEDSGAPPGTTSGSSPGTAGEGSVDGSLPPVDATSSTEASTAPGETVAPGPGGGDAAAAPDATAPPDTPPTTLPTDRPLTANDVDAIDRPVLEYPVPTAGACTPASGDTLTIVFTGTDVSPRCAQVGVDQILVVENRSDVEIGFHVDASQETVRPGDSLGMGTIGGLVEGPGTRYFWFGGHPDLSGILQVG